MASFAKVLTLANLAMELGGMLANRGDKKSPLLLLKYGLTILLAVLTGLMGMTFLVISVIYFTWPEADVVTVSGLLGVVYVLACIGILLYLGNMKRPFEEDPKPVLPSDPGRLMDAFFRGVNGR